MTPILSSSRRQKRIRKWLVNVAYVLDVRLGRYGRSRYLRNKRKSSKLLRNLDRGGLLASLAVIAFFVWFVFIREMYPVPDSLTKRRVTEHLEVYTDLGDDELEFHVTFFEQFIDYFQQEYFPFQQEERLRVYLFATTEGYRSYGDNRHSFPPGDTGFYSPDRNLILVNRESGLGTATHELVHHFVDCGFVRELPSWANEGIANFFEKFIGYIDERGELNISVGYFHPAEFTYTKFVAEHTTLGHVVNSDDQPLQRSLMMFLHKKGLFTSFVRELQAKQYELSTLDALMRVYGADLDTIEADWKAWVSAQPLDENVTLVQAAFVMNKPDWDRWWRQNGDRLYWDDGEEVYKVQDPKLVLDK